MMASQREANDDCFNPNAKEDSRGSLGSLSIDDSDDGRPIKQEWDNEIILEDDESMDVADDDELSKEDETVSQDSAEVRESQTVEEAAGKPKRNIGFRIIGKNLPPINPKPLEPFACYICNKTFDVKDELDTHKAIHYAEKRYPCDTCGATFTRSSTLIVHKRIHTGERPYKCTICGASFAQRSTLRNHKASHAAVKVLFCSTCRKPTCEPNCKTHQVHCLEGHADAASPRISKLKHYVSPSGKKWYPCTLCGRQFTQSGSLQRHERIHTGERPFGCNSCGKRFNQSFNLKVHKVRCKPDEAATGDSRSSSVDGFAESTPRKKSPVRDTNGCECSICGIEYSCVSNLVLHFKKAHAMDCLPFSSGANASAASDEGHRTGGSTDADVPAPFACNICGLKFKHTSTMERHMSTHYGIKPYTCEFCGFRFNRLGNLKAHISKVHPGVPIRNICGSKVSKMATLNDKASHGGKDPNVCYVCGYSCRTEVNLRFHLRTHNIEAPFQLACETCGRKCATAADMQAHMGTHTEPFACPFCRRSFRDPGDLENHKKTHIDVPACPSCGYQPSDANDFLAHEQTHLEIKPYECKQCSRRFSLASELTRHEYLHTDGKPYACDVCDVKFSQASKLKTHMRTHTGEKLYKCSICSKSFAEATALRSHSLSHYSEKHFSSENRGSSSKPACDLKLHQKNLRNKIKSIARSEKTFRCDCGSRFSHVTAFRSHLRRHHGEKPYVCDVCGSGFITAHNLKSHMKTHAGNTCEIRNCAGAKGNVFQCDEREREFTTEHDLVQHRCDDSYSCETCGEEFAEENASKRHNCADSAELFACEARGTEVSKEQELDDHECAGPDEFPSCETCGADFAEEGDLKEHKCHHSAVDACEDFGAAFIEGRERQEHECSLNTAGPCACDACGAKFSGTSELEVHRSTHSGELYSCDACGREFDEEVMLKEHKCSEPEGKASGAVFKETDLKNNDSAGEKPYVCFICGSAFDQESEFRAHESTHW